VGDGISAVTMIEPHGIAATGPVALGRRAQRPITAAI
jgi:hypothetical protein